MGLNRLGLLFAVLSAASMFVQGVRASRRPWDWVVVSGLVLLVAGCGWLLVPESVGYVAGALAILLINLPSWMTNLASRASQLGQYGRARLLSSIAATLHPIASFRAMPRLFEAFEVAQTGNINEAAALLQTLAAGEGRVAAIAFAHRLRILGRWREVKALVESAALLSKSPDPALVTVYLRALGELGYVNELADFMLANERALVATGALDLGILPLFAFTGQVALTGRLLGEQTHTDEAREFWLAVAHQYAGDAVQARLGFGQLRKARDAQIRVRAEERFASLVHATPEEPPSPRTLTIVDYFAHTFADRQRLLVNAPVARDQRRVTQLLVTVNTVIYALSSFPTMSEMRSDFGERWAFVAPKIFAGQWWRVFSYLFVHASALHLLMNMGGLWVLGPFVERAFGRVRFLVIYLAAGCTGSAVYLVLSHLGVIQPEELVGASGCIMGLLGATGAIMLRAWVRQRAPVARQIFFRLLLVVALQVYFDQTTPEVAGLAHALGLLGGFVSALLLRERVSPRQSVERFA
jgi:rhomboid protease GluP